MSVLNPVVSVWDGVNRRAYLSQGVSDFYPIEDIYHEYRHARRTDEELRKYNALMRAEGNISKGAGAFTPRYVVLLEDFKLIPYNESLQINQLGDMITDDPDTDATLYDISTLTTAKPIFIKPSEAETIQLNSESIVFSSFQGAVWVNVDSPYNDKGTSTVPNGNTERPVDNIQLAVEIAFERGFRTIQVIGDITLGAGDDVTEFHVNGTSHVHATLTVGDAALCSRTKFSSFQIAGKLDGDSEITDCVINDLTYFNGHIHNCMLNGVITLDGDANAIIDDCAMLNILIAPTINCNFSNQNLVMTNYSGRLTVINSGVNNNIGIGCDAGEIAIEPSCIDGIIAVSGSGSLVDHSSDDCYVVNKITDGSEMQNLKVQIEQLRPHHAGSGKMIFWDPYSGSDVHHGDAPDRAFKTWVKTHDAVTDNGHDTVVIVPGDPSGVTTITEDIAVTKNYLFVRGPGRDVKTTGVISTSANGTEFSGFRVNNAGLGSVGVTSTGAFTLLENLWFEFCENGVNMTNHHPLIHSCKFHGMAGYAIKMSGAISHGEIYDCTMGDAGETSVQIDTDATHGGIKMRNTVIMASAGYGVSLSATTRKFVSQSGNVVEYNALGGFNDLGVDNVLNVEGSSSGGGLSEQELHDGLDTYVNKDDWKADTVQVDAAAIVEELMNTDITLYNNPFTVGNALRRIDYIPAKVFVDTDALVPGDGSQHFPFDNVNAGKDFAEANGIRDVVVAGDIVVPSNLKNMTIWGVGLPTINFNGNDVKNTRISECVLSGGYTSNIIAERCILADGFEIAGFFDRCSVKGEMIARSNVKTTLVDCLSDVTGVGRASLNMNSGIASNVGVRGWRGGLDVTHADHVNDIVTVEVAQGSFRFTDTCTAGEMVARGTCKFVDETTGATVYDETTWQDTVYDANVINVADAPVTGVSDFKHHPTEVADAVWSKELG